MTHRNFVFIGAGCITLIVAYLYIYPPVYWRNSPIQFAKELVDRKLQAKTCLKYFNFDPFGPSLGERRAGCIYEYAKIKKDPAACELLLPLPYAMSCIGAAQQWPYGECDLKMDGRLMCVVSDSMDSYYAVDQIDNCEAYNKYNNRQVIFWCYSQQTKQYGKLEPCLQYAASESERDTCYYLKATNRKDPQLSYCESIQEPSKKSGCTVMIRAWEKYPQLLSE